MKNKVLLIGLAVLIGLTITVTGCDDAVGDEVTAFDGAYDKPSAVANIQSKTFPGATVLTWDRVYNVTKIDIYRTSTDAGSPTIFLGSAGENDVTYVDRLSGTDVGKNWTPGGSYVYTFVTRNYTGGTISTTSSGTITMNSAALGSNITDWVRSNTQVTIGTPFKAVFVSASDNNPDRVAVTIKNIHPDITYQIYVRQRTDAAGFDTSANNPTGETGATTIGTATGVTFDATDNLGADKTVLITLSGWTTGRARQVVVQFAAPPLFQVTTTHTTTGPYPIYIVTPLVYN
jgi:hypothetical protein